MRRAFAHPLAPVVGAALVAIAYLAIRRRPPTWPRIPIARGCSSTGADRLERAVVRRAPRARLLAAVRAAGRVAGPGVGRRARRAWSRSPLFVPLARAAAPSPAAGAAPRVAVRRRRAHQRGDRADAVPARDRARGRRVAVRGARPAAGARSPRVLALAACWRARWRACSCMLGGRARRCSPAAGRAARGRRGGARAAGDRSAAASMAGCCSPRAATTASWRPRSGRCSLVAPPASRCSRPGAGRCGPAALLYLAVLVGAFVDPDAVRAERAAARRAARAGAARARPRAGARRAPRSRSSASGCSTCSGCPAVRAVAEAHGDPSHARGVLPGRGARLPRARGQAGRARRGAAHAQPLGGRATWPRSCRSRAAGSASSTRRPTRSSTTAEPLTADALPRWLRENARPLGRAAERAAGLLRARPRRGCSSAARRSSSSPTTSPRLADLGGARHRRRRPPAARRCSPPAPNWFDGRHATGRRSCASATRRTGGAPSDACVSRAPGGWTRVDPASARPRASSARALRPGIEPGLQRGPSPRR